MLQVMQPDKGVSLAVKLAAVRGDDHAWPAEAPCDGSASGGAPSKDCDSCTPQSAAAATAAGPSRANAQPAANEASAELAEVRRPADSSREAAVAQGFGSMCLRPAITACCGRLHRLAVDAAQLGCILMPQQLLGLVPEPYPEIWSACPHKLSCTLRPPNAGHAAPCRHSPLDAVLCESVPAPAGLRGVSRR